MILVWSREQPQWVRAHGGAVERRKSQWRTDFSLNSGTYIAYLQQFLFFVNHGSAQISLLCFPLVILSASYWPKPGSVGVRICHYHRIQPRPTFRSLSDIFEWMQLFSTSTVFIATVGMVTFRQSPCWYYPWADVAVSKSSDTQHLWTWWHFGDHTGLINLSLNNISRIHTRRSR